MRATLKFTRGQNVRFISHLDILRLFQRAIMRAELNIEYSNGFNPHMKLGFACALPTGVLSRAEYAELYFAQEYTPEELISRFNAVFPCGVTALEASICDDATDSLMAIAERADYTIEIKQQCAVTVADEICRDINAKKDFFIEKKSKKGIKTVDIKPMIYSLKAKEGCIFCTLAAGNTENLRPDVLFAAACEWLPETPDCDITRTEIYVRENGILKKGLSAGQF